jgi:hypothetical protein
VLQGFHEGRAAREQMKRNKDTGCRRKRREMKRDEKRRWKYKEDHGSTK